MICMIPVFLSVLGILKLFNVNLLTLAIRSMFQHIFDQCYFNFETIIARETPINRNIIKRSAYIDHAPGKMMRHKLKGNVRTKNWDLQVQVRQNFFFFFFLEGKKINRLHKNFGSVGKQQTNNFLRLAQSHHRLPMW